MGFVDPCGCRVSVELVIDGVVYAGCVGAAHEQGDVGVSLGEAPPRVCGQFEEAD